MPTRSINTFSIFLIVPALSIVFFLVIFPLFWALGLSFYSYNVLRGGLPVFIGLGNYGKILGDPYIWERFVITAQFVVASVVLEFLLGFALALLFYQEFKGRKLAITLVTMPLLIAPIASGIFFKYIYDATFGIFTYVIQSSIGVKINMTKDYAMLAIVLLDAWQWTPFMMLFILAGLEAIPKHLLESSEIDRLSRFNKFRVVIWPTIRPLVTLALLFRTMDCFRTFDTVFALTEGGPGAQTELISIHIYRVAFKYFRTGEACALAFIVLVIIILLTNLYLRMVRREAS